VVSVDGRKGETVSITNAPISHSQDIKNRQVRYLLSMLVRTICFVAAVVASGPLRWVFLAAAIFLPYIAVVLANAGGRHAPQHAAFSPEPFGVLEGGQGREPGTTAGPPRAPGAGTG